MMITINVFKLLLSPKPKDSLFSIIYKQKSNKSPHLRSRIQQIFDIFALRIMMYNESIAKKKKTKKKRWEWIISSTD